MKSKFLFLSLVFSAVLANASVEDLANKSFELDKSAKSMSEEELKKSCEALNQERRAEFKGKSKEERKELISKMRKLMEEKYNSLDEAQKGSFEKNACRKFARKNRK